MPSYQVPQFLDSGDKIIGPLNLRQLAYAIIGGGLLFGFYNLLMTYNVNTLWALMISAAPGLLIAMLVAGKYNGRDVELYVVAMWRFYRQPKVLLYKKKPNLDELEERESHLNFNYLSDSLDKRYIESTKDITSVNSFKNQPLEVKMAKIKAISQAIDFKKSGGYDVLVELDKQNRAYAESLAGNTIDAGMYSARARKSGTVLAARGEKVKSMSEKKVTQNLEDEQY